MTVGINAFLLVSGLLFAIGLLGVVLRKNTLVIYMSLELMLNAVNLALVAFSRYNGTMDGNIFVFFIITVAAAEVAVGLAIVVALFRKRQSVMVNDLNALSR
ncbi:NADH-quinone oxidoreductase subunit NuoK [Coraliomargarita akajimensis]|uniref:NADH-quinone oxidoreductase subunit K n=1 Tax=Coraliomargarita akajimensis (strain DSM 45221 / IAM 15411 / JCM 23193 / KCTC 12865 / 04OKA010-24) TaxID=583355 RepID=D5EP84_CORAD|nr:NADH-quinone oxidoreductase subunit NuoK [Coraliomargarita akajimensis]ADE55594.1 NADH-ubiquinone oxidoreductase chain 4L [Coraliomargarita akajimensis DSM 45221]